MPLALPNEFKKGFFMGRAFVLYACPPIPEMKGAFC